ncbi:MAG: RNA polymerase sigma factor [Candidatus Acidiferrales bacterium]
MPLESDESLIGSLAGGDQSALESLYDRYSSLLYSVALRIVGDRGSAEEVLQDSFFQLWQKASQFDSARGSLIGWLLTITRHRAISRTRQRHDRPHECLYDDDALLCPETGPSALEQQIARELVSSAFAGLPNAQREAVTLAYFDGLTCEEIAVHTKTPLGTVKSRLRAALQAMKRVLANRELSVSAERAREAATLDDILITGQLLSRVCRQRNPQQEKDAVHALAQVAAATPQSLIDSFLQLGIDLCNAGTAGLSLLETNSQGEKVFRWTNLAGKLGKHVGGTTPRNFSPCGVTLDRRSAQLFAYPGRHFHYFNDVEIPIVEGLVIPFHVSATTEGTVWIVSHREGSQFDSEDVRIMTGLSEFVGCALHLAASSNHDTRGTGASAA